MMRRVLCLPLAGVLLLLACQAKDDGLLADLRARSTESGFALIASRSESIAVIPFDGPERYFKSRYPISIMTVGSGGRVLAWGVFRRIPPGGESIVFEPIQGQALKPGIGPSGSLWITAFDEKRDRVAFLLEDSRSRQANLHWSSMDLASDHAVGVRKVEPEMSWSPDGKSLAYEQDSKILLLDTTAGASTILVAGHNPNWSPDGKWIAYRSLDGQASLMSPAGVPGKWPLEKYKPLGGLHWAPDGQFVSFSVKVDTNLLGLGVLYRLLVGRVSDGAVVTVRAFGPDNPDVDKFRWISDYKNFCKDCAPGLEFN